MNSLLLLAAPPQHPCSSGFWNEVLARSADQPPLFVYCLHEGAAALNDTRLTKSNVRLFACPRAAERFAPSAGDQVTLGGPGLLAELVDRADRIQAFSPA